MINEKELIKTLNTWQSEQSGYCGIKAPAMLQKVIDLVEDMAVNQEIKDRIKKVRRLTARDKNGNAYYPKCFEYPCEGERSCCTYTAKNDCKFEGRVLERIAAYEDIGLTPDEITILRNHTKLQQREWIPVNDRLPEHDGMYLVCMDDEFITACEYCADIHGVQDWELWAESGEVIAWMPLPEPYRGENKNVKTQSGCKRV